MKDRKFLMWLHARLTEQNANSLKELQSIIEESESKKETSWLGIFNKLNPFKDNNSSTSKKPINPKTYPNQMVFTPQIEEGYIHDPTNPPPPIDE